MQRVRVQDNFISATCIETIFQGKDTLFRLTNTVTVDYLLSGVVNQHRNSKTWIYCHTIPILGRWGDHVVKRITHNALQ